IAVLPSDTTIDELSSVPGISLGVMSTGIGKVPPEQTDLDISQGNRVASSLYDGPLPAMTVGGPTAAAWRGIVDPAGGAPAEILPGLLGTSLSDGDVGAHADPFLIDPALTVVDRQGTVFRSLLSPGLTVRAATVGDLRRFASRQRGDDLL